MTVIKMSGGGDGGGIGGGCDGWVKGTVRATSRRSDSIDRTASGGRSRGPWCPPFEFVGILGRNATGASAGGFGYFGY